MEEYVGVLLQALQHEYQQLAPEDLVLRKDFRYIDTEVIQWKAEFFLALEPLLPGYEGIQVTWLCDIAFPVAASDIYRSDWVFHVPQHP